MVDDVGGLFWLVLAPVGAELVRTNSLRRRTHTRPHPHKEQIVSTVVEVYADITCPFTHVGWQRFVEGRAAVGRPDLTLRVRPWPLELVNGKPLGADFVAEEIEEIRPQVAEHLFLGFDTASFPSSTLAAHALAEAAYDLGLDVGESVSLELRKLLFEEGADVSDAVELAALDARHNIVTAKSTNDVIDAYQTGITRGVKGSPHFFVGSADFFCPGLDIQRDSDGHLHVTADPETFDRFFAAIE